MVPQESPGPAAERPEAAGSLGAAARAPRRGTPLRQALFALAFRGATQRDGPRQEGGKGRFCWPSGARAPKTFNVSDPCSPG